MSKTEFYKQEERVTIVAMVPINEIKRQDIQELEEATAAGAEMILVELGIQYYRKQNDDNEPNARK